MTQGIYTEQEASPTEPRFSFSSLPSQAKVLLKLVVIGLMLLPAVLVLDRIYLMVKEREGYYQRTVQEIAHLWGKEQLIKGPVLSIPFKSQEGHRKYVYVLPEKLKILGDLTPQIRQRGLFEAVVYAAELSLSGSYSKNKIREALANVNAAQIFYQSAFVGLGISDTHSINGSSEFSFSGVNKDLRANAGAAGLLGNGIHVLVDLSGPQTDVINFKGTLKLNGAKSLRVAAVGAQTDVVLKAPWKDPSFIGRHLPVDKEIDDQGFTAHWDISHLGQSLARTFTSGQNNVMKERLVASSFGVKLHQPVSPYRLVVRAIK